MYPFLMHETAKNQTALARRTLDFDGVIHAYTSPWTNAETISDGPVPGALDQKPEASRTSMVSPTSETIRRMEPSAVRCL